MCWKKRWEFYKKLILNSVAPCRHFSVIFPSTVYYSYHHPYHHHHHELLHTFAVPNTRTRKRLSLEKLVYFTNLLTQTFLKELAERNTTLLCRLVVI